MIGVADPANDYRVGNRSWRIMSRKKVCAKREDLMGMSEDWKACDPSRAS